MVLTPQEIQGRMARVTGKFHSTHFFDLTLRFLSAAADFQLLTAVPYADLSLIASAAQLHDLGKISIPDSILDSPTPLTRTDETVIRQHPEAGKAILDALFPDGPDCPPLFSYAREICLHHHERWEGDGYPHHLKGASIPAYVQVVGLADCYDALRTMRSYRPALPHAVAKEGILTQRCGTFDTRLLLCFAGVIDSLAAELYPGGHHDA